MAACNSVHPEDPERRCILPTAGHGSHMDRQGSWRNAEVANVLEARERSKPNRHRRRSILADFAANAARPMAVSSGPPEQAVAKWTKETWSAHATSVCRRWLSEHPEVEFTTAEAWWPLLPKPPEMRAMQVVVQRLRRDGLMVEVGAKRLRGTYVTLDGHEFAENKLVPIYRAT